MAPGRIAALPQAGEPGFIDRDAWTAHAAGLGIVATLDRLLARILDPRGWGVVLRKVGCYWVADDPP